MIFEKVRQIFVDELGVSADSVALSTNIVDDLGADSLDVVQLIMAVEDEFGLSISDEEATELTTVGKLVEYIEANQ